MTSNPPPITVTISKSSSQPAGLNFYEDEKNRILISTIVANGIFDNTDLKPSMEIVSINGIRCHGTTRDFVKSLIDNADGEVRVVAIDTINDAIVVVHESNNIPLPSDSSAVEQLNQDADNNVNMGSNTCRNHPPKGCADGGRWRLFVTQNEPQANGCCVFGVFCILILCILGAVSGGSIAPGPVSAGCCSTSKDHELKDAYVVDGKVGLYIHSRLCSYLKNINDTLKVIIESDQLCFQFL